MAMVHEHCHWDWHLGWTNLSVIMPAWCCTLVPMEVALVLLLPGAIGVGWRLMLIALAMAMPPAWCPPWGFPLEATGVALRLAPGLCNCQCIWSPQCGWLWGVGGPFGFGSGYVWVCCVGAWGPGGLGARLNGLHLQYVDHMQCICRALLAIRVKDGRKRRKEETNGS